ncbi:MAG TPA: class I SAM-dependent methyltransferase [Anaerolineae bacterium]|nr:class I SAM-dependent methyltransferase [Anaerolineae bacterium]
MLWLEASWIVLVGVGLVAVAYWLLIVTEGVYLGPWWVAWLYDLAAAEYDELKGFDAAYEASFLIRPIMGRMRLLGLERAPMVIDVAAGTGRLSRGLLAEPDFQGRVMGVDISRRMLIEGRGQLVGYGGRVGLVQGTAVALPVGGGRVEAVCCLEALEFLPDIEEAIREMKRVLRPGGLLVLTRRRGWEGKSFPGRHFEREEMVAWLTGLGFRDVVWQLWQMDYDLVFAVKG